MNREFKAIYTGKVNGILEDFEITVGDKGLEFKAPNEKWIFDEAVCDIDISEFKTDDEKAGYRIDISIQRDNLKENILTMIHIPEGKDLCEKGRVKTTCEFFWNVPVRDIKLDEEREKDLLIRADMLVYPEEIKNSFIQYGSFEDDL